VINSKEDKAYQNQNKHLFLKLSFHFETSQEESSGKRLFTSLVNFSKYLKRE
jgi:hypothetical protein